MRRAACAIALLASAMLASCYLPPPEPTPVRPVPESCSAKRQRFAEEWMATNWCPPAIKPAVIAGEPKIGWDFDWVNAALGGEYRVITRDVSAFGGESRAVVWCARPGLVCYFGGMTLLGMQESPGADFYNL